MPPTSAPIWDVIEGFGRFHVLVAALEIGLFETLSDHDRPMGTDEIAGALDVSSSHLATLVDGVVSLGFVERVSGGRVELNDTSRRYLLRDSPASMADLVSVSPGPRANWEQLAETVRTGVPPEPVDDDAGFYIPLVEATYATIRRCAQRADLQLRYTSLDRPRVLELGAGGAPWTSAILEAVTNATAVVNDLDAVVPVARRHLTSAGVVDRCEFRGGDYLGLDVEPASYDIVVLGHLLRAESAVRAEALVEVAAQALRPGGRVLVGDYFPDRARQQRSQALMMGVTMMACTTGGAAHTVEDVGGWFHNHGLVDLRLIEPIGFQYVLVGAKPTKPRQEQS